MELCTKYVYRALLFVLVLNLARVESVPNSQSFGLRLGRQIENKSHPSPNPRHIRRLGAGGSSRYNLENEHNNMTSNLGKENTDEEVLQQTPGEDRILLLKKLKILGLKALYFLSFYRNPLFRTNINYKQVTYPTTTTTTTTTPKPYYYKPKEPSYEYMKPEKPKYSEPPKPSYQESYKPPQPPPNYNKYKQPAEYEPEMPKYKPKPDYYYKPPYEVEEEPKYKKPPKYYKPASEEDDDSKYTKTKSEKEKPDSEEEEPEKEETQYKKYKSKSKYKKKPKKKESEEEEEEDCVQCPSCEEEAEEGYDAKY